VWASSNNSGTRSSVGASRLSRTGRSPAGSAGWKGLSILLVMLCWLSWGVWLAGCPSTARILADRNRPHEATKRAEVPSRCSVPEDPSKVEDCTVLVEPRDVIIARELWEKILRGEAP